MNANPLIPDYKNLALPVKKQLGGHILVDDKHIADTMKCGHCYAQWIYIQGSGKLRGFCTNCSQVTCGHPGCNFCISPEQRIEGHEKGKTLHEVLKDTEKEKIFI